MAQGENTSYLKLQLLRGGPMRVALKPYVTYRDYHSQACGATPFQLNSASDRCQIQAFDGARPYRLVMCQGRFSASPTWYWNFWHREEAARGLDAAEDLLLPGTFAADLEPQVPIFFIATAEAADSRDRLREAGLKRAAEFTWAATAASTLDVYREAAANRKGHRA